MPERFQRHLRMGLVMAVGLIAAYWVGTSLVVGGRRQDAALAIAATALMIPAGQWLRSRSGTSVLAVEIPILLLLFSSLTWRIRTSDSLLNNPLDAAGRVRVACVGVAGLLGVAAFVFGKRHGRIQLTSLPFRLYIAYIGIVWAGVPLSLYPKLTAFRAVELTTAAVVVCGSLAVGGERARLRIGTLLYWFTAVLVVTIWVEALLMPSRGFTHLSDNSIPVQWNLEGVYPSIAANGVGFLGVVLSVWSYVGPPRSTSRQPVRPVYARALSVLGLATVFSAQYRTGYLCLAAAILVFAFIRRRFALFGVIASAGAVIFLTNVGLLQEALHVAARGQTKAQAEELSGRVDYWRAAIPVWQESPVLGKGLLTATRFEVLGQLGINRTAGIHSTWVEALVGTGIVGTSFLISSFLTIVRRAHDLVRRSPDFSLAPLLLAIVLGIRSVTGNTFESFQYEAVIYLWLAITCVDRGPRPIVPPPEAGTARRERWPESTSAGHPPT